MHALLPINDGWTKVEYDLGGDDADNRRIGQILNDACHVFHYHVGGTWAVDKELFAKLLAAEIAARPGLVGRLLNTNDRVVKMVTHRAIELNRA